MPKTFKKKDKFADLSSEFKDAIAGSNAEQIRDRVATVALEHDQLMKAKEDDGHLKSVKADYDEANATYRTSNKMTKLKIKYCNQVLRDQGKA